MLSCHGEAPPRDQEQWKEAEMVKGGRDGPQDVRAHMCSIHVVETPSEAPGSTEGSMNV